MALPVVKVDLGDGDYAIVCKYLLRRTQRAVLEFCQPLIKDSKTPEEITAALAGQEDALFGIYLQNQVSELRLTVVNERKWGPFRRPSVRHFSPPFDVQAMMATFDDTAAEKLEILRQEMDRLYQPAPLAGKPASS
jgi:hypothetical protein